MSTKVPWVIEGETGPSTLTKWGKAGDPYGPDEPIGYESWCATCGWHGNVQLFSEHDDSKAWQLACDEGNEHEEQTGHVWEGEEL